MNYPVTVIIPTIESRQSFLSNFCLPSVWSAKPLQLIVVGGDGSGNEKRNAGARAATQPYLLFVDDDSTISEDALEIMTVAADRTGADFVYSGYRHNVSGAKQELRRRFPTGEIQPGKWNVDRLRRENYIDTTSLIRREVFPGFDPTIRRFQDWDLWLTMAAAGRCGVYVPHCLVEKYVIDDGISVRVPEGEAREIIVRKHGL